MVRLVRGRGFGRGRRVGMGGLGLDASFGGFDRLGAGPCTHYIVAGVRGRQCVVCIYLL